MALDNFSSGKEENLSFVPDLLNANHYPLPPNADPPWAGTPNRYPLSANRYTLIKGDIRDYSTCLKACSDVDIVFHQAALRSVPKSMDKPYDYNEVNINGTLNMLKAAKERGAKRFVFASSSSVYGDTTHFPETETDYPLLISPYALTKLAGEYYCRIFSENLGLETVSLRYFNVYGPRQSLDDEYAVVIPKFIHCILNNEPPPIFGNGKQSRDFTYIDNVVEANLLAATAPLTPQRHKNTKSQGLTAKCYPLNANPYSLTANHYPLVFNVANGEPHTVLELVDVLTRIIGNPVEPVFMPPRPGDVFKTLADISQAKKYLGYEPKVGFEEGLRKTVEYWQRQGIGSRV